MPNCEHGPKCYDLNKGHIAFTIKKWHSLLLNIGLLATNVDMSPCCRQLLYNDYTKDCIPLETTSQLAYFRKANVEKGAQTT